MYTDGPIPIPMRKGMVAQHVLLRRLRPRGVLGIYVSNADCVRHERVLVDKLEGISREGTRGGRGRSTDGRDVPGQTWSRP